MHFLEAQRLPPICNSLSIALKRIFTSFALFHSPATAQYPEADKPAIIFGTTPDQHQQLTLTQLSWSAVLVYLGIWHTIRSSLLPIRPPIKNKLIWTKMQWVRPLNLWVQRQDNWALTIYKLSDTKGGVKGATNDWSRLGNLNEFRLGLVNIN